MPHNVQLVIHDKENNACIHYQTHKIRERVLEKDNYLKTYFKRA